MVFTRAEPEGKPSSRGGGGGRGKERKLIKNVPRPLPAIIQNLGGGGEGV